MDENGTGKFKGLTDVFVRKFMYKTDPLRLMFHRASVDDCLLELFNDGLMNSITLRQVSKRNSEGSVSHLTKSSTVEAFFLNTTGAL